MWANLMNTIEKMRQKPEHQRKQIAFLTSLCITGMIFFLWMATNNIQNQPMADSAVPKAGSPLKSLTANVGDAYGYVKELFLGANKTKYSSDNVEVVPGKI